ncbi:hypothetical protein FQA39_LY17588 [Lamprigera yunnana]|nr:hypothetical protein FQA39_LY17588 [Lamprigera yunnana]
MHMKLSTMFLHLPYMFLDESDSSITESIPSAVPDHDDFETILENGQEEIIQPVANNETSAVILKQLIELKVICSRLDSRLETIEKMINTGKASVAFQNYSLLPNLPLNYIEELTSFEEVLSNADGKMQLKDNSGGLDMCVELRMIDLQQECRERIRKDDQEQDASIKLEKQKKKRWNMKTNTRQETMETAIQDSTPPALHLKIERLRTNHKMQPLDKPFTEPLKKYLTTEICQWTTVIAKAVTHYILAHRAELAISGFRATGIYPVNKNIFQNHEFIGYNSIHQTSTTTSTIPAAEELECETVQCLEQEEHPNPGPSANEPDHLAGPYTSKVYL